MNKEELAKQYADKKLSENPRNVYNKLPLGMEKSETNFGGYDIEQAYEDGFDKAMELARKCLVEWSSGYIAKTTGGGVNARKRLANDVLNYFKKYLEEGV